MFTSEKWNTSKFTKQTGGARIANIILFPSFWNSVNFAVKIGYPLLGVLHLVDGEKKPPMGYIYNAMKVAKELIAASFKNKEAKYREIFKIIDKRWDCQLHQPLHATGYYFNPGLYYNNPEVEDATEVISGLQACITKLILTEDEQIQINTELLLYRRADGIFRISNGKENVSKACASGVVDAIWSIGTDSKKLHSKKRNRLKQSKVNDLVYIKYNRALRRRYDMRDTIDLIILDDGNLQDPNEWLKGALKGLEENEENALVHEAEDLTYGDVATAVGANEAVYYTRRSGNTSQRERSEGTSTSRSSSRPKPKRRTLVDEDDFDVEIEENDVAPYKHLCRHWMALLMMMMSRNMKM
ncbi:uncharacterized protein LOC110913912 [Helianthus annuus]|uniref:uncharacterized protein LOC110913912 n=1 Tax=Helianthus annuus TaxID=4232 RepID=UPI000B8FFCE2|nr:uncharacterized protein LOC110913912 [Helianthus annuus]